MFLRRRSEQKNTQVTKLKGRWTSFSARDGRRQVSGILVGGGRTLPIGVIQLEPGVRAAQVCLSIFNSSEHSRHGEIIEQTRWECNQGPDLN